MKFSYIAFDTFNKIHKGITEAANLREATRLLIEKGWYIKKIRPKTGQVGFFDLGFSGVSLLDKLLLVKHLGTMLKSGISLNEALAVIAEQATAKKFRRIITNVLEQVKAGQTLAGALAKHPRAFDPLFVNIIKVGEQSGTLEENLGYLTSELEDRLDLQQKIKAASFYPAIVLLATFGLGFVLAYFVLPKISRLFKTLNFPLPMSTKILLWLAEILDKYGVYIFLGIIFGLIFFRFLFTRKFFKPLGHWLLLKLPIVGNIVINYNLALISRTLGVLLRSGLTIDQAISATAATSRNVIYQRRLQQSLLQIQKGKRFSDILAGFKESKRLPLFPLLTIKMISIGERSGRLSESLSYLAEYFEKEVDNLTKNLAIVLEPILLIFVGLIIGFVAVSVITPIYQVTGKFRK